MSERSQDFDPIDTPLTISQPVNSTSVLGREGVDDDFADVAAEADAPDEEDDLDDEGDEELDDTGAGADE